jgi:hypothetical protein
VCGLVESAERRETISNDSWLRHSQQPVRLYQSAEHFYQSAEMSAKCGLVAKN